uniref:Uncharacterized protein n=1 Tax=Sphaerodactylus townsendi TaxID=933632 RepID=A0ACB8FSU1_9SAUR
MLCNLWPVKCMNLVSMVWPVTYVICLAFCHSIVSPVSPLECQSSSGKWEIGLPDAGWETLVNLEMEHTSIPRFFPLPQINQLTPLTKSYNQSILLFLRKMVRSLSDCNKPQLSRPRFSLFAGPPVCWQILSSYFIW